jgi:hypothetical protein
MSDKFSKSIIYTESIDSTSSKPKDFVIVIFGSIIIIKGATSLKANADETHADIRTNYGSLTISQPGNYIISSSSSGIEKTAMTEEEYFKAYKRLSSSDVKKLQAEKKIVKS